MFKIGKPGHKYVDPDNYGQKHEYMDYLSNLKYPAIDSSDEDEVYNKWIKQIQIVNNMYTSTDNEKILYQRSNLHYEGMYASVSWDTLEHFKFLKTIYSEYPYLFPRITQEQFVSFVDEFYKSQPVQLILPCE